MCFLRALDQEPNNFFAPSPVMYSGETEPMQRAPAPLLGSGV